MREVIITDTSILILFKKIGEFELLKDVYRRLIITPEIESEFGETLPEWVTIRSVSDKKFQAFLTT